MSKQVDRADVDVRRRCVTIGVGNVAQNVPYADAATLAEELRAYARGGSSDARSALVLAAELERRIDGRASSPIGLDSAAELDVLHRVLNVIVYEIGPTMKLYNAISLARRAA